jgi:hypothetical protein
MDFGGEVTTTLAAGVVFSNAACDHATAGSASAAAATSAVAKTRLTRRAA